MRLLLLSILVSGCAATIELTDHQSKMADQKTAYETRLQRCEEDKAAIAQKQEAEAERFVDAEKVSGERIVLLEGALADKQRLLDDVSSQLVELQGAFSKLSLNQKKKMTDKSAEERRLEATLGALKKRFGAVLKTEIEAGAVELVVEPNALVVRFADNTLFARGSARLSAPSKTTVASVAAALNADKDLRLQLSVHTDNVAPSKKGKLRDTWALTGQQGLVLVRELQKNGVDPSRLHYVSRGQFRPIATNDTKEGRAKNRRIELRLLVREL